MSAWRRAALDRLPGCRSEIEQARNQYALWIDLRLRFERAFEGEVDHTLIRAMYDYASWCLQSPDSDSQTAAVVCFYEHLPAPDRARSDMPNHISKEDFAGMTQIFKYHATDKQYEEMERLFYGPTRVRKPDQTKKRRPAEIRKQPKG